MTAASDKPNAALVAGDCAVVLGLGIASRAVIRALLARSIDVTAIEDRPTDQTRAFANEVGCALIESPAIEDLEQAFVNAAAFIPSPGVPESHPAFGIVAGAGVRTLSEFDLASWWDDRPVAAVTGTDGKTSVTLLTVAMLNASGVTTAAVGNTDVPLIEAIADPAFDAFVVEASSFRLGHGEYFAPKAAAWLNFSPDHLDVHATLEGYEKAKARIWRSLPADGLAVAPVDDWTVRRHLPVDRASVLVGLTAGDGATAYVEDDEMVVDGTVIGSVADLPRAFDHDITNTMVAAALAMKLGATVPGIGAAITSYELPPHRIQHVATKNDVAYYNDSKATVPHAVVTAVKSFPSVVLIAGGRNKDLDLGELRDVSDRTRIVIAMGDAANEIAAVFDGVTPVEHAVDMDDALRRAHTHAVSGDAVLLSPGCTSFDAYENYGARGDDFIRAVHDLLEVS